MHDLVIYTNNQMKGHNEDLNHPECPQRLDVILEMIKLNFDSVPIEQSYPLNEDLLLLAHPQSYIDSILDQVPYEGLNAIDGDTYLSPYSYDAALLSAGSAVNAVQSVLDNESKAAFALSRPPGHHAEYETAMGFCLFSNAFIAARTTKLKTIIIDFDVHHGNGTEDLVKKHVDGGFFDIAYVSTHGEGIFPNTGLHDSPNICNCPMEADTNSENYRKIFIQKAMPFIKNFNPEFIIFSAGFDAHYSDPLGNLNLDHSDFAWIVDQVKPLCSKMVSILEGGYNLETLPTSVHHHLKALAKQI